MTPTRTTRLCLAHRRRNQSQKKKAQILALKTNCTLFSRLYIACQRTDGNLDEFFSYENQTWPSALGQKGE